MVAIRSRRTVGSKVTGAAPKPPEHYWRCWVTNSEGRLLCPPGPDGRPKPIYGGATAAAVQAALDRHIFQEHPTPEQKAAMAYRRPPATRRPVKRHSGI